MAEGLQKGKKGKGRNRSLHAISPCPTVFSNVLVCRHVKNKGLFGRGLNEDISLALFSPLFHIYWYFILTDFRTVK